LGTSRRGAPPRSPRPRADARSRRRARRKWAGAPLPERRGAREARGLRNQRIPQSASAHASIGWRNRQGLGDTGNQFHYYRLTDDDRILWGGYEAGYHFGSRIDSDFEQDPPTFEMLSRQFFDTFPQLEGLRFTHSWGGPIGTTTRFCMDVGTAHGGRAAWAIGYTGLGVGASRFGARVALDLLDRPEADHLSLRLLRRRAVPWPPEPLRYIGVQLTRRAMAKADQNEGRRGPWLRLLDSLGLGFDS
jgi:hypothetical protein